MGQERDAAYYDAFFKSSHAHALPPATAPWAAVWAWAAKQATGVREVLDVGCGLGHLASLLVAKGVRVVGVDFSEFAIAQARIRAPKATFYVGNLPEALAEIPHNADLAICCEFLEHIECDLEVLTALHDLPVVVTLPTFDCPSHVRHFPTAESVVARYGVKPTAIGKTHWGLMFKKGNRFDASGGGQER